MIPRTPWSASTTRNRSARAGEPDHSVPVASTREPKRRIGSAPPDRLNEVSPLGPFSRHRASLGTAFTKRAGPHEGPRLCVAWCRRVSRWNPRARGSPRQGMRNQSATKGHSERSGATQDCQRRAEAPHARGRIVAPPRDGPPPRESSAGEPAARVERGRSTAGRSRGARREPRPLAAARGAVPGGAGRRGGRPAGGCRHARFRGVVGRSLDISQ